MPRSAVDRKTKTVSNDVAEHGALPKESLGNFFRGCAWLFQLR